MRKLLLSLLMLPMISFASDSLDMSNLKCGKLQIYSSTTLQEVQDSCLIRRQYPHTKAIAEIKQDFDWIDRFPKLYDVQFFATTPAKNNLVRCDFESQDPKAALVGCR